MCPGFLEIIIAQGLGLSSLKITGLYTSRCTSLPLNAYRKGFIILLDDKKLRKNFVEFVALAI